ncbi:hypothetical protein CROQUDRAFT_51759, partial [Cronartium quercuum f. sp. fusiforme G11]
QASQYNKRRRPQDTIQQGDWVLLEAENRGKSSGKVQGGSHKLKEKYEGPYRVQRLLNQGQNLELDLNMGDEMSNNFHISKVKPYHFQRQEDESSVNKASLGSPAAAQK